MDRGPHGVGERVVALHWRFTSERVIPAPCPCHPQPPKAQQPHGGQVDGLPGMAPLPRVRSSRACCCLRCAALPVAWATMKAGAATQEPQGSRACCTCCGFVALWPCRWEGPPGMRAWRGLGSVAHGRVPRRRAHPSPLALPSEPHSGGHSTLRH